MPNKMKGDLLENLVAEFLRQQSYAVTKNLRNTGTEIDVLAEHLLSGQKIIVECKAQKGNVGSAAVDALFTDVHVQGVQEGWLITLGELGGEAKGKITEIQRGADKRFTHIPAHFVVEHVVRAGLLVDVGAMISTSPRLSAEVALILTPDSRVYCVEHLSADSQSVEGYTLVDATTLSEVSSDELQKLVAAAVDRYSEGKWLPLAMTQARTSQEQLPQVVVELAAGSDWKDYRPSRPEDFIGREEAIANLCSFIEEVRLGRNRTRLFGIKANSGWGKSSLVLKAAQRINAAGGKAHFLAVDCRAAVSSDYPHLALAKALSSAREKGVEFWGLPTTLPSSDRPFEDSQVKNGLEAVRRSGALVVLVFDQFEEIIHAPNRALFGRLENLCYQVDALQVPVLLGFSWRTDAMVSADNPGYNLWHRLSDRRHDVQLRAFTHADAITYIERAERNSGQRLAAKDRRFVLDKYVGFPWLLKKLTVNILTSRDSVSHYSDETSAIAQIFEDDLEGLNAEEHACIKSVAANAPIPIYSLTLNFPESVVSGLVEKRLFINAGGQLSLYSDIFRDYVLYNRLPQIPNTYCPYVSVPKLVQCASILASNSRIGYAELASRLRVAESSVDNIARDLHQMRIVKLFRAGGMMTSEVGSTGDATSRVTEFLRRHVILEPVDSAAQDSGVEFAEIVEQAVKAYRFSPLSRATIEQYCAQILRLACAVGVVEKTATRFWWGRPIRDIVLEGPRPVRVMSRTDGFMAQAPPERVMALIENVRRGRNSRSVLMAEGFRNSIFAANSLRITRVEDDRVVLDRDVVDVEELLDLASAEEFVAYVSDLLSADPKLSGAEIGVQLAEEYGLPLHPSSLQRYGSALRRWVRRS